MPQQPFGDPLPCTVLPKLEHMPLHMPQSDISRSARGRSLLAFASNLNSPHATDAQLIGVERAILSVQERSSFQFQSSLVPDVPLPPLSDGRAMTRSQMLELRKANGRQENQASFEATRQRAQQHGYVNMLTSLPQGRRPGAPGKRPGYRAFSHLETQEGYAFFWGGGRR